MHPRNIHQSGYDFDKLIRANPGLKQYLSNRPDGSGPTIDFADHAAVKALNQALLMHHYQLSYWDIPEGYLCPAVPGRADYIHHLADLLTENKQIPKGVRVHLLDIGTGANFVYPILANRMYGWSVIGTDIDLKAIQVASALIEVNDTLSGKHLSVRHQADRQRILTGIIRPGEQYHATICNPPFFTSEREATEAYTRKQEKLGLPVTQRALGGRAHELWTPGGEPAFLRRYIRESQAFAKNVTWFTSLVSQKDSLAFAKKELERIGAAEMRVIPMAQGQKKSRVVAWKFETAENSGT